MSTDTAIQVVWWVGLVAALGLTAVAVKLLSELLRTLGQLRDLAERTATAADGVAAALSGPLRLDEAADAAETMRSGAVALRESAGRVWSAVDGARPGARGRVPEPEGDGIGAGELGGAAGGPGGGGGGG